MWLGPSRNIVTSSQTMHDAVLLLHHQEDQVLSKSNALSHDQ